ncbi:DUF116 domain-containing protein [Candidatus Hydrogenedentota bacterium]
MFSRLNIAIVYPILRGVFSVMGGDPMKFDARLIRWNNARVSKLGIRVPPDKLLLLLPHCLQNWDCEFKITGKLENCRRCGKCVISDIVDIAREYGIFAAVATGGTLALRIVKEKNPSAIVAVACERDLAAGIREVFPYPVYGIANMRPEGPCMNTQIDAQALRNTIEMFLENRHG